MTERRVEGRTCITLPVTGANRRILPIIRSVTGGGACHKPTRWYRATRESPSPERVAGWVSREFRRFRHDSREAEPAIVPDRHSGIVARVTLTFRKAEPAIPGRRRLQHPEGRACNRSNSPSEAYKFPGFHGRRSLQRPNSAVGGACDAWKGILPPFRFTEGRGCTDARPVGGACNLIPAKPRIPARDSGHRGPVSLPYIYSSFFIANVEVLSLASLGNKEWPHSRPCLEFPSPSVRAYALTAPHLIADGPDGPSQRVEQAARTEKTSQQHFQAQSPSRLLGEGVLLATFRARPNLRSALKPCPAADSRPYSRLGALPYPPKANPHAALHGHLCGKNIAPHSCPADAGHCFVSDQVGAGHKLVGRLDARPCTAPDSTRVNVIAEQQVGKLDPIHRAATADDESRRRRCTQCCPLILTPCSPDGDIAR